MGLFGFGNKKKNIIEEEPSNNEETPPQTKRGGGNFVDSVLKNEVIEKTEKEKEEEIKKYGYATNPLLGMVKGTQPNAHEEEKRTLEEKEERKKQEKNFEKTKEFITTLENLKKYSFQKEEEINELLSFQEKIKEEGLDIAHVEGNPHDSEEKQIKERVESFKKILLFPSKLNEIEGFIKLDIKSLEETIEDKEERNRERERLFKSSRAILDTNTLIKNEIEKNAIAHPMEIQKIFEDAIKSINPELFNTSFLTELSMLGDVFLTKDNRKNFLENSPNTDWISDTLEDLAPKRGSSREGYAIANIMRTLIKIKVRELSGKDREEAEKTCLKAYNLGRH